MAISLRYDRDIDILYATAVGNVPVDDFKEALRAIVSAEDFPPTVSTLWDIRKVDFDGVDNDYLATMINERRNYPERSSSKIAIVAPQDLSFGISRMYAAQSDVLPQTVRVFRAFDEAEIWLQGNQ